eukprot:15240412-Alexandrium_andersonii.AAC.1
MARSGKGGRKVVATQDGTGMWSVCKCELQARATIYQEWHCYARTEALQRLKLPKDNVCVPCVRGACIRRGKRLDEHAEVKTEGVNLRSVL